MTIEILKSSLEELKKNSHDSDSEFLKGYRRACSDVLEVLDEMDKPDPVSKLKLKLPPQPKTLKVVIDGVSGVMHKWRENWAISSKCQIVELLISPVSGAKAEEPPAPSQEYDGGPSAATVNEIATKWSMQQRERDRCLGSVEKDSRTAPAFTEVKIDAQGERTIRKVKFTTAEQALAALPVDVQVKFQTNSDHSKYSAVQGKDCLVIAILENGSIVFFNPKFAYPDISKIVYWRISDCPDEYVFAPWGIQSSETMPTLNRADRRLAEFSTQVQSQFQRHRHDGMPVSLRGRDVQVQLICEDGLTYEHKPNYVSWSNSMHNPIAYWRIVD